MHRTRTQYDSAAEIRCAIARRGDAPSEPTAGEREESRKILAVVRPWKARGRWPGKRDGRVGAGQSRSSTSPTVGRLDDDEAAFLVELVRISVHGVQRAILVSDHIDVDAAVDVPDFAHHAADRNVEAMAVGDFENAVRVRAVSYSMLASE